MERVQWFWSVQAIDVVVFGVMIVVPAILIARLIVTNVIAGQRLRFELSENLVIIFVGLLAVYVAYASLRNQTRQAAEISLNAEADALFAFEMDDANGLRCLYPQLGWDNPAACRANFTASPGAWSKSVDYVEESLFMLKKARRDRRQWGSSFAKEIAYWADDVSADPTGLFSYYLVSNNDDLAQAKAEMREAGLCMPNLCHGYSAVRSALGPNADRGRPPACRTPQEIASAAVGCKPSD
ncbi:MAG TPA: hypothetical protein VIO94_05430 [Phenylobacterium sp.]